MNDLKEKKFRDHIWAYQNYFICAAIFIGYCLSYIIIEPEDGKSLAIISGVIALIVIIVGYRYNKKFMNEIN